MAIDVGVEGDPQGIRAAGAWLRSRLSAAVHDCHGTNQRARSRSEAEWTGAAGDSFRDMLTGVAPKVDELAVDVDGVGRSFEDYADALHTAQQGMRRAREIALAGGLQVSGTLILDPGPAPAAPQALPADASPSAVRQHQHAVSAQQSHAARVRAYAEAKQEADLARSTWRWARDTARAYWKNLWGKRYLSVGDFANGVAGEILGDYKSGLTRSVSEFDEEIANLRKARSGTKFASAARRHIDDRIDNVVAKQASTRISATSAARFGKLVPVAGLVIAGIGAGMDIRSGKPPGKVIVSTTAGVAAGALTPIAIAAVVGSAPVSVTALAAVAVGVGASMAAKWAYEEFVPQEWKDSFDHHFDNASSTVARGVDHTVDTVTGTLDSLI